MNRGCSAFEPTTGRGVRRATCVPHLHAKIRQSPRTLGLWDSLAEGAPPVSLTGKEQLSRAAEPVRGPPPKVTGNKGATRCQRRWTPPRHPLGQRGEGRGLAGVVGTPLRRRGRGVARRRGPAATARAASRSRRIRAGAGRSGPRGSGG